MTDRADKARESEKCLPHLWTRLNVYPPPILIELTIVRLSAWLDSNRQDQAQCDSAWWVGLDWSRGSDTHHRIAWTLRESAGATDSARPQESPTSISYLPASRANTVRPLRHADGRTLSQSRPVLVLQVST